MTKEEGQPQWGLWGEPVCLEVGCREGLSSCLLVGVRRGQKASQSLLWRWEGTWHMDCRKLSRLGSEQECDPVKDRARDWSNLSTNRKRASWSHLLASLKFPSLEGKPQHAPPLSKAHREKILIFFFFLDFNILLDHKGQPIGSYQLHRYT